MMANKMDVFFGWRWWLIKRMQYYLGKNQRWYKKKLIANLSTIKNVWKTKIKSKGDEVTDFCDKKTPMVDSNHTC